MAVSARQSVASLRKQIALIPECADGSPAWTINGWSLPKILLGTKLLKDSDRLIDAGVISGCTLQPVYDSTCYVEPILDLGFYGGGGQLDTTAFSDNMPDCTHVCQSVKKGSEHVHRGFISMVGSIRDTTGIGALCIGGAGIAVSQDESLSFRVTHVAPSGPADQAGIRVGDVITAVGGTACVDGAGLDPSSLEKLRRVTANAAAAAAAADPGFFGWLGGGGEDDVGDGRAISAAENMRRALAGLPGTWVQVCVRRGGGDGGGGGGDVREGEVVEMRMQRKSLAHYAGDYM